MKKNIISKEWIDNYNSYGNPKNKKLDDIQIGDLVEYHYNDFDPLTKKRLAIHCKGIWNGSYVECDDIKKTIVRTTEWLKKL